MTRPTQGQLDWINKWQVANKNIADEHKNAIAEAANELYELMSEFEAFKNQCMTHGGYASMALTRDALHREREAVKSLSRRYGSISSSYPINLIGGEYRGE